MCSSLSVGTSLGAALVQVHLIFRPSSLGATLVKVLPKLSKVLGRPKEDNEKKERSQESEAIDNQKSKRDVTNCRLFFALTLVVQIKINAFDVTSKVIQIHLISNRKYDETINNNDDFHDEDDDEQKGETTLKIIQLTDVLLLLRILKLNRGKKLLPVEILKN